MGISATVLSSLIFVLHDPLSETVWLVLIAMAVLGFCAMGIAAWVHTPWWLLGLFLSLLLIVALIGAIS
jgi:hypothetical protein